MNLDNIESTTRDSAPVMIYTQNILIWGNLPYTGNALPGRVLVGNTIPDYLSLIDAKSMDTNGSQMSPPKSFKQFHIPVDLIIGFHLMPPAQDQVDYDESEQGREFKPFSTIIGSFTFNGAFRLPSKSNVKWIIESSKSDFISFYHVSITHTKNTKMSPLTPQIAYIRRKAVFFAEN